MLTTSPKRYRDHVKRLFAGYTMAAVALMILLFLGLIAWINWYVTERENRSYNQALCLAIEEVYREYQHESLTLAQKPEIRRAAQGGDPKAADELLRDFSNRQRVSCNYVIFNSNRELVFTNLYETNRQLCVVSVDTIALLDRMEEHSDKPIDSISRAGYSNGQETVYQFGSPIWEGNDRLGYLILDIRRRSVFDQLAIRPVNDVVLVDKYQNLSYTTLLTEEFYTDKDRGVKWNCDWTSRTEVIVNRKPYYATRGTGEAFGRPELLFYTLTSTTALKQSTRYGALLIVVIGILLFAVMRRVAGHTASRSLSALDDLLDSTNQWSGGNMEYRIPPQPYAEFQSICDDFNSMMDRVQSLIARNSELNDTNYQMELRNMESQFNPHFVFNILETIKYMILVDETQASGMIVSFARLLRYSINYGQATVALRTDIEYIEAYLGLQKQRFGKRLTYEIDIEPQLLDCKVPKLLLQPLVENAIVHNAEHVATINIEITGRKTYGCIELIVCDNGRGMTAEQLLEIEQKMQNGVSIGLRHVDRTLRLRYGDSFGLKLQSEEGKGCKAIVFIPLEEEP